MRSLGYLSLMLPCALAGCATAYRAGAPEGGINVIAHRGGSAYAPENTLASFSKAIELGADWFELDTTLSKDGELIVIHDNSVDRTTDGKGAVADLNLSDIKTLDAGSWFNPAFAGERLPTLGEALDLAKGRIGVYIEIKNSDDDHQLMQALKAVEEGHQSMTPAMKTAMSALLDRSGSRNIELTRKCIEAIRARKMKRQVVIQSFSPVICLVARLEAPELRTEYLGGYNAKHPEAWPRFLAQGALMGVEGFNLAHTNMTREHLERIHGMGKTVAVWTVDSPYDMRRYVAWGVDGIITNRPDVCLEVLKEAGAR